jgi:hypothetical protein
VPLQDKFLVFMWAGNDAQLDFHHYDPTELQYRLESRRILPPALEVVHVCRTVIRSYINQIDLLVPSVFLLSTQCNKSEKCKTGHNQRDAGIDPN